MDHLPEDVRSPSIATRAGLVVLGLALVFGAVLAVELGTGNKAAESLPLSPRPLIPSTIDRYGMKTNPDVAAALRNSMQRLGIDVSDVEAASVLRQEVAVGTIMATRLTSSAESLSRSFRAGVLAGAAGGFGIDLKRAPFILQKHGRIDVYATSVEEGRLVVWFFRDAFCQLFVDAQNASDASSILDRIIAAQLAAASAPPG